MVELSGTVPQRESALVGDSRHHQTMASSIRNLHWSGAAQLALQQTAELLLAAAPPPLYSPRQQLSLYVMPPLILP